MPVAALIAWIATAVAGLYLLAIWLIENDPDFQRAAPTRLPVPVVCGHVLFAVGGLVSWVIYLATDKQIYSLIAAYALALIAILGLTMAVRSLGGYRARPRHASARADPVPSASWLDWSPDWGTTQPGASAAPGWPGGQGMPDEIAGPPERHFPVSAVVAHGLLAFTTIALVVLTVLGVGGS